MSPWVSPLLFLYLCSLATAVKFWSQQRDDLSEYQLIQTAAGVRTSIECAGLADETRYQAVVFNQSDGSCSMFSCLRGVTGCRKCRNARNSSLPLLLVNQINQLGHNCWRTFQHRVDGSVDFYRNWTQYLASFGQGEDLNYWMGLEAIHQLTQAGDRRARWEMSLWNGTWYWWEDSSFAVQGADQGYRVTIGAQDLASSSVAYCSNGNYMNNQKFSTPDRDQDVAGSNCAVTYQGAWWYAGCHCLNPNGRYFTPPTAISLSVAMLGVGITFASLGDIFPFNHLYSMQTFECMISDIV